MSFISKNDRIAWQNYINNFKDFNINFSHIDKDIVEGFQNKISQKSISLSQLKLIKQGKVKPDGILDLHGYKLQAAKIILQKYIMNAYEKNIRNVLIITGKGYNNTGILKKEVPLWLNDKILTKLLINYKIAPKNFGGEGALLVRIKNKNKNLN
tara:strand:+ start:2457 stop:2918 length:462 start_codon:yes stop_codon:yes gene_type:complete